MPSQKNIPLLFKVNWSIMYSYEKWILPHTKHLDKFHNIQVKVRRHITGQHVHYMLWWPITNFMYKWEIELIVSTWPKPIQHKNKVKVTWRRYGSIIIEPIYIVSEMWILSKCWQIWLNCAQYANICTIKPCLSNCCLMPTQQFFSYIMARTS